MKNTRRLGATLLLFALVVLLLAANLNTGSVRVSPAQVWAILQSRGGQDTAAQIVWQIRLPRLLAAALLGGALSVSGFLLQTFFQNPIAGPFVLGISSGAKLTVALCLILALQHGVVLGSAGLIGAAFVGSLLSMGVVLLLSGRVRRMSRLIICGVMIGYICSAITDFAVTFADDSNIVNLHNWSMGSFSGIGWGNVPVLAGVVAVCLGGTALLAKPMGAYRLGEVYAASVGVRVGPFRAGLILLSSLLSACVTAFAGPISFVGIAVPQLVKSLYATSEPRVILPASFLGGAAFCLFSDLLARTLFAPTELGISSVTAVLGAPVVIWMMLHREKTQE